MTTMRIITSTWNKQKTFKLIPISADCPYNEGIFDPETKTLAIISKDKKQSMHMVTKLNESGDPEFLKIGKRLNGKDYKEERKILETFYEYYIEDKGDILNFLSDVAVNYKDYLKEINTILEATPATGQTSNIIQPV